MFEPKNFTEEAVAQLHALSKTLGGFGVTHIDDFNVVSTERFTDADDGYYVATEGVLGGDEWAVPLVDFVECSAEQLCKDVEAYSKTLGRDNIPPRLEFLHFVGSLREFANASDEDIADGKIGFKLDMDAVRIVRQVCAMIAQPDPVTDVIDVRSGTGRPRKFLKCLRRIGADGSGA